MRTFKKNTSHDIYDTTHPCRYVLSYIETLKGVARGAKVWQLSFGSGFKCNSAVWVANKAFKVGVGGG